MLCQQTAVDEQWGGLANIATTEIQQHVMEGWTPECMIDGEW